MLAASYLGLTGAGTRARLIAVIFEASPAIHGVDLGDGEYDNYDEGYGFRYYAATAIGVAR